MARETERLAKAPRKGWLSPPGRIAGSDAYGVRDVRRLRVAASVALIAGLAAAAVPGSAGSQGISPASSIAPSLFHEVQPAIDGTATTTPTLDPAQRAEAALHHATAFLEPADTPVASGRPDARAIQPAAPTRTLAIPEATTTSGGRGWRHDPDVSWYGPGFYGRRTACGYALTTTLLGVAHRTLPCGTKITFRNPANGRTITVKVIDRGPYVTGRQWDMTGGLCVALDHCFTGPMDWRYG